jgi:O-antigen/teichoic acid export membrane protein
VYNLKKVYWTNHNCEENMSLTTRTIQGVGWSAISQIFRLLLQFVITVILARLLTPNDFGLLAMVVVFTNFVSIFRDFGLTAALIQRKGLTEEHLSSSFWINILAGFFLALVLSSLAPAIAYFYGEDRLTLITIVLSSTFFISSFGIVQTALLTKELKFKFLAIIDILGISASGTVAVILAFSGFGVWSLVLQQVIFILATVILLWSFSGWRPKFLFHWRRVKELLGFGLNLTGFSFVNYFNRNLDNLLIGKFLGSASLGFYNLAYRLLLFPLWSVSSVIGRVMFPALSTIHEEKAKVRLIYLRATRYIAALTFPMMIGLFAVAPQVIRTIFGLQWERSIFLVQVLALVGLIESIETTTGWLYQSQGRTDIMFRWGLFFFFFSATAFVLGLRWNIEGVAVAYAAASFLLTYPCFAIPFRFIDLKFSHFIKQFNSIFLASVTMGGIVFGVSLLLKDVLGADDLVTLISSVAVGAVIYSVLLFVLDRTIYREVFQLFRQSKPMRSADAL